jgi:hypothetical protein
MVSVDSSWRHRLGRQPVLERCYRGSVFAVGLLVVLAGCALWLLSVLVAIPAVFAGVWLWSKEFEWGRRLLRCLRQYAGRLLQRVRRRPARWTVITVAGVALGAASLRLVG